MKSFDVVMLKTVTFCQTFAIDAESENEAIDAAEDLAIHTSYTDENWVYCDADIQFDSVEEVI